jgi:hypothetical protein
MDHMRVLQYQLPLMRGDDVRAVQLTLIGMNVSPPCGSPDGVYAAATKQSVLGFQKAYNIGSGAKSPLKEDGVVGPDTWSALFSNAVAKRAVAPALKTAARLQPPLNPAQMKQVRDWLRKEFNDVLTVKVSSAQIETDPPFDFETACAIAGKEAAIYWLPWTKTMSASDVLARCVFDASGDVANASRTAFPQNTAIFRQAYPELADMLIDEANQMRALRSPPLPPGNIVYKGYGIFQYDLQNIKFDRDFFAKKLWYQMPECAARLVKELEEKNREARAAGELGLRETVRRYNGSGAGAEMYADVVMEMREWLLS